MKRITSAVLLLLAYVTLTDNTTNDSTFVGAQLGARPNQELS